MAKEPNLIKKHMLDSQLREELDGMAKTEDVRTKADAITFDDLDSQVRTRILNNPTSPHAYDDTDLRNRVASLESNKIDKSLAFNKNTDVVSNEMLNEDLQGVISAARFVNSKIDTDLAESTYRKLSVPIEESDMSADFRDKFTRTIQKVNNVAADSSNTASLNEQIDVLRENIATLSTEKVSADYINANCWTKAVQIPISGLEASAQNAINQVASIDDKVNLKANVSYVDEHFRKNDVAITAEDLTQGLRDDIALASAAATNVSNAAEIVVSSYYYNTILPSFVTTYGTTASADLVHAKKVTEDQRSNSLGIITLNHPIYSEHYHSPVVYDSTNPDGRIQLETLQSKNELKIKNKSTGTSLSLQLVIDSINDNKIKLKNQYANGTYTIEYYYADISDEGQRIEFQKKTVNEQVDIYLNYIYPYNFYHKVSAAAGTYSLPNIINPDTGESEPDPRAGKATFTAFFNWIYSQLTELEERITELEEANG